MEEKKLAYISILTTEDYLDGLKVTFQSLRQYTDKEMVVLVNESISESVVRELSVCGMRVLRANDVGIKAGILSEEMENDRWRHTLFKLRVFGITEYDSLIYLDSDMLICGNPDDLFFKEHMSAVADSDFFPDYGREGLNAGIFSFHPSKELEQNLIEKIPEVAETMDIFGDQDVINALFKLWGTETALHLGVQYNACFYCLDTYNNITPVAVHFILKSKPWMWSGIQIFMKSAKWVLQGKKKQCHYLKEYVKILKSVR